MVLVLVKDSLHKHVHTSKYIKALAYFRQQEDEKKRKDEGSKEVRKEERKGAGKGRKEG